MSKPPLHDVSESPHVKGSHHDLARALTEIHNQRILCYLIYKRIGW